MFRLLLVFTLSPTLIATINDTLGTEAALDRASIADFVHDIKIDLDLWLE